MGFPLSKFVRINLTEVPHHYSDFPPLPFYSNVYTFNVIKSRDQLINRISWSVDGIIVFDSPNYARAIREVNPSIPIVGMGTAVAEETDAVWVDRVIPLSIIEGN
jgi:hypothetical protein